MWRTATRKAEGDVELIVRIDDDDPAHYPEMEGATTLTGPRTVLSECWNECFAAARGDVLMHAGDDIIFRTQGWDQKVADAFESVPDRILFVYGRDGYQDEKLGTHGFLHRRWVETVGYFVPPYFSSDFNDLWLHEVSGRIDRRRYLPNVFIEHMHPVAGKGEWDLTHQERLARHKADRPHILYSRMVGKRREDAKKLRAAMESVCA